MHHVFYRNSLKLNRHIQVLVITRCFTFEYEIIAMYIMVLFILLARVFELPVGYA